MKIRDLREQDLSAVAFIERETFSQPWSEADFLEMIRAEYAFFYVAVEETVLGYCGVRNLGGDGEITNVAVSRKARRKGVAAKLLGHLIREGGRQGIADYTLEVRAGNAPALALYHKLGFRVEGIRPDFYQKPVEDALIMWKRNTSNGEFTTRN